MGRIAARVAGWLLAAAVLYGALLMLDVYWNIVTWQVNWDAIAVGIVTVIFVTLLAMGLLARSSVSRAERIIALVISLFFFGLGIYVLPAEPLSDGLFERQASSPFLYRTARFAVMLCPLVFWVIHQRRGARKRA